MKKRSDKTQTLRAGCSKAEPKIVALPQTSFPGARDGKNLISWRWSLPLPTNRVRWGSMNAISSYCGNRPTRTHTHTHTHAHTQSGPIKIHCAAACAQCNYIQSVRSSRSTVCIILLTITAIYYFFIYRPILLWGF